MVSVFSQMMDAHWPAHQIPPRGPRWMGAQQKATLPVPLAPQPTQNHMADPAASTSPLCTWPLGVESETWEARHRRPKKPDRQRGNATLGIRTWQAPRTGGTAAGTEHASLPVSGRFDLTRVIAGLTASSIRGRDPTKRRDREQTNQPSGVGSGRFAQIGGVSSNAYGVLLPPHSAVGPIRTVL